MGLVDLFKVFKADREQQKRECINSIVDAITQNTSQFTHAEQTEILSRVTLRVFEDKKEKRAQLIKEARELQDSLINIKIF